MYDPISDAVIPTDVHAPDSFWAAHSTAHKPSHYPSLLHDINTDVAIIGAGFTGLSAALHLQKDFQTNVTLIEANQPGWGASGRNGGFVLPGTGRLGTAQLQKQWGKPTAQAIYKDYLDSVSAVQALIDEGIDCDYNKGGYLKLAHQANLVQPLQSQAELLSRDFADNIVPLDAQQIEEHYLKGPKSFGGVFYPDAFSVNPWRLCQGLAQKASTSGVNIYGNTAAKRFEYVDDMHHIYTEFGKVTAKTLIIASNAYGLRQLHPIITDRMFPVMSSILVTKPLSPSQLDSIAMKDGLMVMDTRPLKYYYRLLPDKRLLFGGRGPVKGKHANNKANKTTLLKGLNETFRHVKGLDIDYFWSGWVSVSLDDYPRIYHDTKQSTLYSGGYCGAGLAFSIQAGKRLAQLLCSPEELPTLPYWQSPLKRFPFANLRRPALRVYYSWENFKAKL